MYQMGHLNKSKNPEIIPSYNGLIACSLIENRDFILLLYLKKQGMQQGPLKSILIDCICLTSQFPLISGGSEQQGKDLEKEEAYKRCHKMYSTYNMFNVCDLCDVFHYLLLIGKCRQGLLIHKMPGLVTGNCKRLKDTYTIDTTQKRNSSILF